MENAVHALTCHAMSTGTLLWPGLSCSNVPLLGNLRLPWMGKQPLPFPETPAPSPVPWPDKKPSRKSTSPGVLCLLNISCYYSHQAVGPCARLGRNAVLGSTGQPGQASSLHQAHSSAGTISSPPLSLPPSRSPDVSVSVGSSSSSSSSSLGRAGRGGGLGAGLVGCGAGGGPGGRVAVAALCACAMSWRQRRAASARAPRPWAA